MLLATSIIPKLKRTFKSHIVYKIFFTYIILVITLLFIISIIYYSFTSSTLSAQTQHNMKNLNEQIMINIDKMVENLEKTSFLVNYEDDLNILMRNSQCVSSLINTPEYISIDNYFFNFLYSFSQIHGVYIYSLDGNPILCRSRDLITPNNLNVKNEDWFQDTLKLNGRKKVSGKHFNTCGKTEVFSLSRAIYDFENDSIIGIIVLEQDISEIESILQEVNLQSDSSIMLLDENRNLIYSNNVPLYENLAQNDIFLSNASKQGAFNYKIDDFSVSQISSSYTGWKLFSLQSNSYLMKDLKNSLIFLIYIFIACLFITFILSLYLSEKLTANLKKVKLMMDEVNKGNLNIQINVSGSDEIATIAAGCNTMLNQIKMLAQKEYGEKLLRKEAELQTLLAQINPHFLYNTLGFIKFSAQKHEDFQTADMIQCLANLLRYNLGKEGRMVTLENELNNAKNYLTLQKQRFGNKFNAEFQIAEFLLTARIPAMILQPILENSFIHGFENKIGKNYLYIECFLQNDDIHLIIKDNGVGISPEKLDMINKSLQILAREADSPNQHTAESIGIYNVHMRIIYCFGQHYGLSIHNNPSGGTIVKIILPHIKE